MSDNKPGGVAARAAAQAILNGVLHKHRPLDLVIETVLGNAALDARDAGFARVIAGETLRRYGMLKALVRGFVPKAPPSHRAGPTSEILLAGACELLFLDVAPHAVVDAANRLAQADHKAVHFKALINAVLRRISREGKDALAKIDPAKTNVPDWLWRGWIAQYGEETARNIAQAHLNPAPLDLVMKDAPAEIEGGVRIAPDMLRLGDAGRIEALPGYNEGAWWVQDFAASLPVRLFGDVAGKLVMDLCAAPGGKTAQLAARGAQVIAVEREPERMARLRENLVRLQLNAELVEADIAAFEPAQKADCVLLDAPCSATGTIRRHPDLPWTKSKADVTACASTAKALLHKAAQMVAPGGTLIFAVCSLEREEGEDQISAFLKSHSDFARAPIGSDEVFGMSQCLTPAGDLRTLPCHLADQGGLDGFYAARLKRT